MNDLLQQKWITKRDPSHFHTLSTVESEDGRLIIQIGGNVTPEEQAKIATLVENAPYLLKTLDYIIDIIPDEGSDWWFLKERQEIEKIASAVDNLMLKMEE